jgi:hypothetical protein
MQARGKQDALHFSLQPKSHQLRVETALKRKTVFANYLSLKNWTKQRKAVGKAFPGRFVCGLRKAGFCFFCKIIYML